MFFYNEFLVILLFVRV